MSYPKGTLETLVTTNLTGTKVNGNRGMRTLVNQYDWSATPLGAIEEWPEVLRLSAELCLNSAFPLILWWGPERTMIYNDSYVAHLQSKHPNALGKPGPTVFSEIWSVIGPMLDGVFETGDPTYSDDLLLFLERKGYPEETYHTFSYSAIKDSTGEIVGIFTPVAETTEKVIAERRQSTLRELSKSRADNEHDLLAKTSAVLAANIIDLPACAFYSLSSDSSTKKLLATNTDTKVQNLLLSDSWVSKVKNTALSGHPVTVTDLQNELTDLPTSILGCPLRQALLITVPTYSESDLLVFFTALSPHQELDEKTITFMEAVATQISSALKDARAYEHERRKAEELLELDRAKTAFFNNVSHEFRTPLTLMLGPLERLLDLVPPGESHQEIEVVQRNAMRLLKMVNSLLDFSRIEAGRYEGHFETTNLQVFTEDLASAFRSAVETAGLELEIDCATKDDAYVDREMWEKIVFNLLSNAFKFTTAGKISITLQQKSESFELTVKDSGIGIPAEELPNLFKRFHRLRSDGARTYEGSGIGLAMVQELVRMHGGTILVQSEDGVGTKVIVDIPTGRNHLPQDKIRATKRAQLELKHAASFIQEASGWNDSNSSVSAEENIEPPAIEAFQRIIIADDNADMRNYLYRLLNPLCTVELVSNGKEALKAIERQPADLLITDIMMPIMSGIELLESIRSEAKWSTTPVLLLSARAGEEARASGLEAGADDYLVKPFSARELYARVGRLLQKRTLSNMLESAILERTKQLTAALEAKSRFLSTISHEVRTPIAGVIGLVELLAIESQSADTKFLANTALDSSRRLLQILNNLLDASKLETGKVVLEHRKFSVRPIIGDIIQLARPDAMKKSLHLTAAIATAVPDFVIGDELRLRQILTNLLFNAVKFTANGEVSVSVSVIYKNDGKIELRFDVSDTGIGIAPEQQDLLFEPFMQASDSTTRIFGGTGLGLSIAKDLVTLMNGEIGVESTPGKGSTFWVQLPFSDEP